MLLPAIPTSSKTRRSGMPDIQPRADARCLRRFRSHSPPRRPHHRGIISASRRAVFTSTLKVRKSRLFTPMRSEPASTARCNSSSSWASHSTSSPSARLFLARAHQFRLRKNRHNEQNRVGAASARLQQLKFVHDEIFLQAREFGRWRRRAAGSRANPEKILHPSARTTPPRPPPPIPRPGSQDRSWRESVRGRGKPSSVRQ